MYRPKLLIKKKFYLNDRGNYRYYSAAYDRSKGKLKGYQRPKCPIIDLDIHREIQTEKQLMQIIYHNYGVGEYLLFAICRGVKGAWVFWQGHVTEEGFLNEKRDYTRRKSIQKLKEEQAKAETEEEKQWVQEEIDLEKEINIPKNYGFKGHIKNSGQKGHLILWEELDQAVPEQFESWEQKEKLDDSWGVSMSRKKEELDKFESWR